jgi:hypothetical protein
MPGKTFCKSRYRRRALWILFLLLTGFPQAVSAQDLLACPADYTGYLRPLLTIGQRGEIRADGVPLRARAAPALSARLAFQIEPGTSFVVVAGPACADGYLWWRILYEGQTGWAAESSGAARTYYVQPAPALPMPRPAIARDTLNALDILPFAVPAGRFDTPAFAPRLLLRASSAALELRDSSAPGRVMGRLDVPGRIVDAVTDSSGDYIFVGAYDSTRAAYNASLYRYRAGANPAISLTPPRTIDLSEELPLTAVAISAEALLTLHSAVDESRGALVFWSRDAGERLGSVELPMSPAHIRIDATGQAAAVSAVSGLNAQTVLIDLPSQQMVASAPDYGVIEFNPYPGSGREQLLIGKADGRVAVYLALPSETASPPQIIPARLARLGEVEVFVRRPDITISVTSLAIGAGGTFAAVGGESTATNETLPDDFRASVAFLDMTTFIVDATSVSGDDWRSVDDLAFSADASALWVSYRTRQNEAGLSIFGVSAEN